MGSKRPGCTLLDALSNTNMPDHKLHPGGKMSRDPSPRPPGTGHPERERDGGRERRETEPERTRDKARRRETDLRGERNYERDGGRREERERRERERRPEDERRRNGRPGEERKMKKGDTFPRMRKDGRVMVSTEERGERRERDGPQRAETDKWARERERTWQRDRYRERERGEGRGRPGEEERLRFHEPDVRDRRRDGVDSWDARERDRRRERQRNDMGERASHSTETAQRRDGKRDTRSEGDSDERETRRARDRATEELTYQQSRSEGDNEGRTARERERGRRGHGEREGERSGRKGGERERERYRESDRREEERRREREYRDERVGTIDRREKEQRREKEERREDRRDEARVRNASSPRAPPPRAQSSGEWSSDGDARRRRDRDSYEERESKWEGERVREERRDSEEAAERGQGPRHRSERDRREGTEGEREQRRMWLEPQRDRNSKEERQLPERRREEEREGRGKEGENERYAKQRGHGWRETEEVSVDGEQAGDGCRERYKTAREQLSESDGGMEGSRRSDGRRADNAEESDGEEERGGVDYRSCSGSEGGSEEAQWRADRERMLSGEDIFVTLSSGGDEERGSEEDEFKDCQEFFEGGVRSPVGDEDEKQQKIIFCVIGQTLPRSDAGDESQSQVDRTGGRARSDPSSESRHHRNDDATLPRRNDDQAPANSEDREEISSGERSMADVTHRTSSDLQDSDGGGEGTRAEHPYDAVATIKRDSQTEKLLREWREKNKEREGGGTTSPLPTNPYENVPVDLEVMQPFLEQINSGAMSPEEVEAIRIRMSGAWSMSEEPKRHSQAPHLKWAKTVVREILGKSEEQTVDGTTAEAPEDQGIDPSEVMLGRDAHRAEDDRPVFKLTEEDEEEEEHSEAEDSELLEGARDDEEDDRSKSWGEVELRNVLETINRQKRNSRFFNAAQLYQQYSEEAQNFEILRQARSELRSEDSSSASSPAPSPPPARRPLPPLPSVPHPHSLAHGGSVTSVRSLPLPEPPRGGGRPPSPRLSISLSQSPSLWRDLPAVRNSTELEELSEDQRRLQEVRFEVVTSEASYCRSLDIVVEHFVKSKQLNTLLTTQDRNWLFSRLADVRAISHSFLSKLEERVESDMISFTVCDIIARHCQRFKMVYVPYLTNQSYQDATYQRLMNENPGFRRVVEKLERSHVCQRLPLRSFLVLPFQRITRIKLLVQNIVKRTTPGTPEATHAIKSLKLIEKLIQESNDSITQMKSIESLVSLSSRVDFECRTLPLISQSRRLVREGLVTELMDFSLKDTERNVYMHLFNDYLLLSLQREGGRFTVIDHCPVSELRAENCRVKLHSLQKNLFRLHLSRSKALLLRTDTQSDKLRWISALSRPHPEVDFSAAQDFEQMQCIRAVVAQQPDEQSLEKADVILVHQQSSDNWVEGTRLSDRQRGWIPKSHLELISNSRVRQRNLSDALKLTTATAAV